MLQLPADRRPPLHAALVAAATFAALLYVWGSLDPIPIIHDEAAILLQARIFALFRWVGDRPPLPEFFEQFHVFVVPHLAPKYPPGHALLLLPGVWAGVPALVPLSLAAASAAMLFLLARRFAGTAAAYLTLVLWVLAPASLVFRPSYLSEPTTEMLLLAAWLLLLRYRERPRAALLAALAAAGAWAAITRPLTAVAIMLPVLVSALVLVARRRRWLDLLAAAVPGLAICAIVPLWSARTTGDWKTTPYALYSATYFPFDVAGLGTDESAPKRELPEDFRGYYDYHIRIQRHHTAANLPSIAGQRSRGIWADAWSGSWTLLAAAIAGLLLAPFEVRVGALSATALFVAYLFKAHAPEWRVYYFEAQPVLAFLAALGIARLAGAVSGVLARRLTARSVRAFTRLASPNALTGVAAAALLADHGARIPSARHQHEQRGRYGQQFHDAVAQIPDARAIVFVKYAPGHNFHQSVIANEPDLSRARLWIVYDRGADDARLTRLASDRTPYLYEERDGTPEIVRTLRPMAR